MFSTLRTRFGIPGVISVIALVFAMFGGAYAASNSASGGKATASAKAPKAKKGPRGPKGAKGDAGPAGLQGPAGPAGAKGDVGAAGASGASVTSKVIPTSSATCKHFGGTEFTSASGASTACNGEPGEAGEEGAEGEPWSAGGTLPSKATETGMYLASSEEGKGHFLEGAMAPISFTVPLPTAIAEPSHVILNEGSPDEHCENTEHAGAAGLSNPEADPGYLCLYPGNTINMTFSEAFSPTGDAASVSGSLLFFKVTGAEASAYGAWAVTAP